MSTFWDITQYGQNIPKQRMMRGTGTLRGVSLKVKAGQVVSVSGPNGAGKSKMFKTLFGLLGVTDSSIVFDGKDVTNQKPADLLRAGIAFVPQGHNVFPLMTVDQNLRFGAYVWKSVDALEADIAHC